MKNANTVQSIMDSLRRLVRALRTASRESQSHIGLRAAPLFVLQQLEKFEPLSLNDLAMKTHSHQSTVSVVVTMLVKKGLVRRTSLKKDRRYLVLETTAKGKSLLKKQRPAMQQQFSTAIESMPPADRKQLSALLERFVAKAGLAGEVPHFFFEKENSKAKKLKAGRLTSSRRR